MGLVINKELYELFYNIITNIKINENKKNYDDFTQEEKKNMGICYNKLLLYFIMSFQEAYEKQKLFNEKTTQNFKDLDDTILNIMKIKKSDSYSNLLNNSYESTIWDLIKNNELINNKFNLLKNENNYLKNKYNDLINQNFELKK